MSDIELLESVLKKDEQLLGGVGADQLAEPTMCPDYDVEALVNHLAGWVQVFAGGATGEKSSVDPTSYVSDDPAGEFGSAAERLVAGWREHGTERTVRLMGGEMPGAGLLSMTLMEYVTHGCDLALATGQPIPFSDEELETTLERAETTLPDEYRGEGKPFGDRVEVPDDAPLLTRFLGFMGRRLPSH